MMMTVVIDEVQEASFPFKLSKYRSRARQEGTLS